MEAAHRWNAAEEMPALRFAELEQADKNLFLLQMQTHLDGAREGTYSRIERIRQMPALPYANEN